VAAEPAVGGEKAAEQRRLERAWLAGATTKVAQERHAARRTRQAAVTMRAELALRAWLPGATTGGRPGAARPGRCQLCLSHRLEGAVLGRVRVGEQDMAARAQAVLEGIAGGARQACRGVGPARAGAIAAPGERPGPALRAGFQRAVAGHGVVPCG
jgi:hypothetical protein